MRILLVFFLSCEQPGPLILNYLAALGKGYILPETSDATGMCWAASDSATESNKARKRPSSFQLCLLYPSNLILGYHSSYIFACAWRLMYPRCIRAIVHMQIELQCMCCKISVQNVLPQCTCKSVVQWAPYAINLSCCACVLQHKQALEKLLHILDLWMCTHLGILDKW